MLIYLFLLQILQHDNVPEIGDFQFHEKNKVPQFF